VPAGAPAVAVQQSGLSWTGVPSALFYDVVRGGIGVLASSAGDFSVATQTCLANDVYGTSAADATLPPEADGFWYLVRAASCGGAGSYEGGRDAEIAASGAACP
jgi:hypothetical protein